MMILLILIILTLLFSAFFSGSEIAFVSTNKLAIELRKASGSRRGRILGSFFERPDRFLGTMLVGNNIALVLFTLLMAALIDPLLSSWIDPRYTSLHLLIATVVNTIIVLIFGEFLPKVFFRVYANDILYFLTYPLALIRYILGIPAWIMTELSNLFLKYVLRIPLPPGIQTLSRLDLEDYMKESDSDESIETEMFNKALNLKELKVRDCMVPRTEIVYIDVSESVAELRKIFGEKRHSRIIITDGDIDNVLGYVHHQNLLENPKTIRKAIMEVPIVPEVSSIHNQMSKFIRERTNIAVVVDEFGGTSGLITLEDMLEEIFGEIEDEHDDEEFVEEKISETEYRFSGRLEIDYLNEKYPELEFPEGDFHTLSGYIVMTAGTIPEQGVEVDLHGYHFVLEKVSEKKIETVRVILSKEVE